MSSEEQLSFGQKLRLERESHHWSRRELSEQLVGDNSMEPSIYRWEEGSVRPHPSNLAKLCEVFGKPEELWGAKEEKGISWNVPYLRNPYFTGREQVLSELYKVLNAKHTLVRYRIRALTGLGGIGKTQTALEYAYRYKDEYEAVLWVKADSKTLASDFARLALTLKLPVKEDQDQQTLINAVKDWLQNHSPWLLIFDNVDDLNRVLHFLPRLVSGAIILTTRSQDTGSSITPIAMEKMSQNEGVTFLLCRTLGRGDRDDEEDIVKKGSTQDLAAARELWELMDGLPLALDQAGAYIKAGQASIAEYRDLYRQQSEELLQERGRSISDEHPDAVTKTFFLSFQEVEHSNPAAAELLRLCAFLSPDAIPEELLTKGATHLPASLQVLATSLKERITVYTTLGTYSLLRRDSTNKLISLHRLVQAVLIDGMPANIREQWKERIIRAINLAFPQPPFKEWVECDRLLPQVLSCISWDGLDQEVTLEAASLFDRAGTFLREWGQYSDAEALLVHALKIREQLLGEKHLDTAICQSNLAGLYSYQGRYKQAETLVRKALATREHLLGKDNITTATSLGHLAVLYIQQGKYEKAEQTYLRVIPIYQQIVGENVETAKQFNNLGVLYGAQGKYEQSEEAYQQAHAIYQQKLGEHIETARSLNNLAEIHMQLKRYKQAEDSYQQAIAMYEKLTGSENIEIAYPLFGLAELYRQLGKYNQAEQFYQRALSIREQTLEANHSDIAVSLQGLANLYSDLGRYERAVTLLKQVLAMREKTLEISHPETIETRKQLISLLHTMGLQPEATPLEATQAEIEGIETNPPSSQEE